MALSEEDAEELETTVRLMFTHPDPAVRASARDYAKALVTEEASDERP